MNEWRRVNAYAHWDWSSDQVWVWGDRVLGTNQQWVAKYTFKEWVLVDVGERSEEPQNADEVASEKVGDVAKEVAEEPKEVVDAAKEEKEEGCSRARTCVKKLPKKHVKKLPKNVGGKHRRAADCRAANHGRENRP